MGHELHGELNGYFFMLKDKFIPSFQLDPGNISSLIIQGGNAINTAKQEFLVLIHS
jgi:hypothetical protein